MLPLQGAWVRSLVGQLKFHMPCNTAPHPPKKEKNFAYEWKSFSAHKLFDELPRSCEGAVSTQSFTQNSGEQRVKNLCYGV